MSRRKWVLVVAAAALVSAVFWAYVLAAGYLEPAEVGIAVEARASLYDVQLAQLADEVARRVGAAEPSA